MPPAPLPHFAVYVDAAGNISVDRFTVVSEQQQRFRLALSSQPKCHVDRVPAQTTHAFGDLSWLDRWHGDCVAGDVSAVLANGCRVMVVDDDQDNRELVITLLEQDGFLASGAENGADALALLEKGLDPDLILTDLMMPVMSGWDLCETLKSTRSWQCIPIIVLCGMPAEQRGQLQVDDAFEKPTDTGKLLNRIRELCGI